MADREGEGRQHHLRIDGYGLLLERVFGSVLRAGISEQTRDNRPSVKGNTMETSLKFVDDVCSIFRGWVPTNFGAVPYRA